MSWLSDEGTVRDCLTGEIIRKVSKKTNQSQLFSEFQHQPKVIESAESREQAFKKIFENRNWGGREKGNALCGTTWVWQNRYQTEHLKK